MRSGYQASGLAGGMPNGLSGMGGHFMQDPGSIRNFQQVMQSRDDFEMNNRLLAANSWQSNDGSSHAGNVFFKYQSQH
jgi:hypothetical protein